MLIQQKQFRITLMHVNCFCCLSQTVFSEAEVKHAKYHICTDCCFKLHPSFFKQKCNVHP